MSEPIIPVKCVLLGESGVGKSSIINRFISNTFRSDFSPTMVGCYSSKEVYFEHAKQKISFEIWDTAGQEKYRSINKIFYQDAIIAILVYDITRKESYEAIKNYWYIEVRDNSPKEVLIAIVGNKSDKYEFEEVNEDEVKEFCNSINAIYKVTSAALGEGINELFDVIGNKLLTPEKVEEYMKNNGDNGFKFRNGKGSNNIYTSVSTLGENDKVSASNIKKKKKCC